MSNIENTFNLTEYNSPKFIHLRLHSEYSLVDGLIDIKPLIKTVAKLQMPAVAVTDQLNLFGSVKLQQTAFAQGVKPIFGADLLVYNEQDPGCPFILTCLCQNHQGYLSLVNLLSRAWREGSKFTTTQAMVAPEWIFQHHEGLIILSGERYGEIGQALLRHDTNAAHHIAQKWLQRFDQRFYIELQRNQRTDQKIYEQAVLDLSEKMGLPVVATNDVRFLHRAQFEAHEARVCIQQGVILADPNRPRLYSAEQYLKSAEEMCKLFADIPEACANSIEIAQRCNLELRLGKVYLPTFPTPEKQTAEMYCASLARAGLIKRFEQMAQRATFTSEQKETYQARLESELDVINRMGFASYFLIVADFIAWAKSQKIPVGPGRGSGAGSLVAYALEITDLDPLPYDLLFERFLNPERVSMPDFDIDFCMIGRDRVIEYVTQKYGRECVSQIITFGTMAAKAVIRDVGRVLGHPYGFVDRIAKLIPFELGITLEKALNQEEELANRYQNEEEVRELIDLGRQLEGLARNAGKHAGGVVIAPSALTDYVPLYCELSEPDSVVTQFDKDDSETIGLIKFDFLGLRTLTIIDWAVNNINHARQQQGLPLLDCSALPFDDPETYQLFKTGETTAVFQVESRGMKELIRRLQPDCFEDLIALVALYRPGPLQSGMVEDFIDRKHGRAHVVYPHPDLIPILKSTYGVILYQEQVMQIAQVLGGYTLGGADLLRRAMGKKKAEEMVHLRKIFVSGAKEKQVNPATAEMIFDLMEKFAGYGFNKSHSAAYALLSYQTAWLKTHYPSEYMAAVLSSDMDNTDKVVIFLDDCRRMGLKILPPDINASDYYFTVPVPGEIRYGLGAIKGVGEAAVQALIEARHKVGTFSDLFQCIQNLDSKRVNKRTFEALIRAGAFDSLQVDRAVLLASIPRAFDEADLIIKRNNNRQTDLFSQFESQQTELPYIPVAAMPERERLQGEKATLGHYMSGHPLDRYQRAFNALGIVTIRDLPEKSSSARIAGQITHIRSFFTKTGKKMAVVGVEDAQSRIDVTLFSDVYSEVGADLQKEALVVIEGEVNLDEFTQQPRLIARKFFSLERLLDRHTPQMVLHLAEDQLATDSITQLNSILQSAMGGRTAVRMHYQSKSGNFWLNPEQSWQIQLSIPLIDALEQLEGISAIELDFQG